MRNIQQNIKKYRFKVNLEKLGVSKYFHFSPTFRDEVAKGDANNTERVNFESLQPELTKPFERTIAALKEIPEVNSPISKLEYIYQVFNTLMIAEIDDFWRPLGD